MSRRSDRERGARMAMEACEAKLHTLELFREDSEQADMWASIFESAEQQLAEERWSREVTARA